MFLANQLLSNFDRTNARFVKRGWCVSANLKSHFFFLSLFFSIDFCSCFQQMFSLFSLSVRCALTVLLVLQIQSLSSIVISMRVEKH